jgi:hypothetical protein
MRFGIGLIGLLLAVALILVLFAGPLGPGGGSYGGNVAEKNRELKEEANRLGGRDADGQRLSRTLELEAVASGGELDGVRVTSVQADGVAATHFGLEAGDVIREIGRHEVGGFIIASADAAGDFLDQAFSRSQTIRVERAGEMLELPAETAATALPTGPLDGLPLSQ